jgi:hypothetical protein
MTLGRYTKSVAVMMACAVVMAWWLASAEAQTKDESRTYYLEHKHSGKYAASDKKVDGTSPFLWGPIPAGHEKRYQFKLVPSGVPEFYYLVHEYSGKYLGAGTEDGDRLVLWGPIPKGHEDRYRFKFVDTKQRDGALNLLHKASGKFVGAGGGENDNGAELLIWGPIPKGHEDRYGFRLFDASSEQPKVTPSRKTVAGEVEFHGKGGKIFADVSKLHLSPDGTFFYQALGIVTYRGTWDISGDRLTMTAREKATGLFEPSKPISDENERLFSKDALCTFDHLGRLTSCESWRGKRVTVRYIEPKK